ncbi:hypothetical protein [Coraliomargarita parva]|uniref:hypothetical protein n=1 Tax=Coraliomargarita parva TaxID=3014050 RepID=UPI0022B50FE0|nr:hypothetical protein [Coraliomargarita parva]
MPTKQLPVFSISLISLVFVAAYFVLRSLPDAQCGFLHYEEVVNADGEIEFCATNHAGFLDLSRLEYPLQMRVLTTEVTQLANPVDVTLVLETSGGTPIAPHELALTHTKKMHVMVIDPAMEDYHHVHPEPEGLNGRYHFSFTPQRAGTYRVFTEIVPVQTRRQLIATGEIEVNGLPSEPRFERNTESIIDGVRFRLGGVPERLKTGRDYRFSLEMAAADGGPIELEMIMGAKGHMVAFDQAGRGFAHMHPEDSVLGAANSDDLAFLFNVPNPGWYRLFAQIQVNGHDMYGHFDLLVD